MGQDEGSLAERAKLLSQARRHAEAAAAWRTILAADPADAFARCQLAGSLIALGEPDDALRQLQSLPAGSSMMGLVSCLTGEAHLALGHARRARAAFSQARGWGFEAPAWDGIARCETLLRRHAAAGDAAHEALRLAPHEPWVHRTAGFVALRARHLDDAERHLRQALRLDPQDADALGLLGDVIGGRGGTAEGQALLERAVRLAPDHRPLRQRLHAVAMRPPRWVGTALLVACAVLSATLLWDRESGFVVGIRAVAGTVVLGGLLGVRYWELRHARRKSPLIGAIAREEERLDAQISSGVWWFVAVSMTGLTAVMGVSAVSMRTGAVAVDLAAFALPLPFAFFASVAWWKLRRRRWWRKLG